MVDHRSAALLIRVWREDAGEFRARLLTLQEDADGGLAEPTTAAVASSPGSVLEAVRAWLEDVTRPASGRADGEE